MIFENLVSIKVRHHHIEKDQTEFIARKQSKRFVRLRQWRQR